MTATVRLLLVPGPLDFGCAEQVPLADVLPAGTLAAAAQVTHWICENAKTARACLKRIGETHPLALPIQQQRIVELPREVHKKGDHTPHAFDARPMLQDLIAAGAGDIGLLSEAGMPAVADPGSSVVRAAHHLGLTVVPLVGPVSLLLTLAASGLNGQDFAFVGYLPQEAAARSQRLRELEATVTRTGQTQLFIETPYRNLAMWQSVLQTLQAATRVAVGSGLTLPDAQCMCAPAGEWKKRPAPVSNDRPAVYAIGL